MTCTIVPSQSNVLRAVYFFLVLFPSCVFSVCSKIKQQQQEKSTICSLTSATVNATLSNQLIIKGILWAQEWEFQIGLVLQGGTSIGIEFGWGRQCHCGFVRLCPYFTHKFPQRWSFFSPVLQNFVLDENLAIFPLRHYWEYDFFGSVG